MSADGKDLPRARLDLFMHTLPDGTVCFDPRTETTHLLNATASFIFACCDGAHDVDAIIDELREAMGDALPGDRARGDVEATLVQLRERGLFEVAPP